MTRAELSDGTGPSVALRWAQSAVAGSIRKPVAVLAIWGTLAVIASGGVLRLKIEPSPASFLDRRHDAWDFYQESSDVFGGDEFVAVAIEAEQPWDPRVLADVQRMSQEVERLPGVRRVDSLATVPSIDATPDGPLRLDPPLGGAQPLAAPEVARVQQLVARDRIAPDNFVSADGRVFALNVLFDRDRGEDDGRQAAVLSRIDRLLEGQRAWVSGVPVFEVEAGPRIRSEILTFVPLTVVLLAAGLTVVFGSVVAPAASLLASGIASLVMLGAMGALGAPLTLVTMTLPSLWLAFGSAYAIHLLAAARGRRDRSDLIEAMRPVAPAVALSGLTTAAGFFALGSIRLDAIRGLGLFGGIGVLVVLAATLTVVPAMLSLSPLAPGDRGGVHSRQARLAEQLIALVSRWRILIVGVWLVAAGAAGLGVMQLTVETDASRWWPPGSRVREHFDTIRKHLSGISPINVVITAREDGRVTQPAVLAQIDALASYLEQLPEVGRAVSVADPLRQIHGGFTDDATQPLPAGERLIEQYLLLLESMDRLWDLLAPDRSQANIVLRVNDNASYTLLDVAGKAESWWREHGAPEFQARSTGIMFEYARIQEAIAWGQIYGLMLALLAIGAVLFAVFRTPVLVGIALIANVLPLLLIYGLMGAMGIPLDGATACVGSVALGIAVDDTVHVLTHFRTGRLRGMAPRAALTHSLRQVLAPLVYTTFLVAIGFAVVALSGFAPIRNLGIIFVSVLVVCLLADTTLLPALLLLGEKDAERHHGSAASQPRGERLADGMSRPTSC